MPENCDPWPGNKKAVSDMNIWAFNILAAADSAPVSQELGYSEISDEKETDCRTNHLARDFGDGEKIGGRREACCCKALRRLRSFQYTTHRTPVTR